MKLNSPVKQSLCSIMIIIILMTFLISCIKQEPDKQENKYGTMGKVLGTIVK